MFTYSQLEELYASRRKGATDKPMRKNTRLSYGRRGDDVYYAVQFHGNTIGRCFPGDIWQVDTCGWSDSPRTRERIDWISDVSLWRDNRTTGLEHRLRCNGNLPFVSGLKFRNGVCINPEDAPADKITTIKRSAVAEVTKKLRPLKALMTTMARCEMFDINPARWYRVPGDADLAEPTAELASRMFADACCRNGYNQPAEKNVEFALSRLRGQLYESMPDAYHTEVIYHGHDQRQAA